MENTIDHKCPSCNATLKFNPHGQNWKCDYCRNEFSLDDIEKNKQKDDFLVDKDVHNESSSEMDLYTCPNCGAQIVSDPNTSATFCVYCKSTAILKDKLQGEFNPDYVIPFRLTKEDAVEAFKKLSKGKILMPKAFNDKNNIQDMRGIYIPFWIYDYEASGEIHADCTRVTSWTSGNYRYTKTDTYLVIRGGNMAFNHIPVDGSTRFDNDIMNSIEPFDYKDLKKFNYSYLSGFLSEKYDVNSTQAKTDAVSRAENSFVYEMKRDIVGYTTVNPTKRSINLNNSNSFYALLPVWMLNIKYKEKIYTFAMNGQTGKLIGNIPIDKKKAIFMWLIIFIAVFGIMFAIFYLRVVL